MFFDIILILLAHTKKNYFIRHLYLGKIKDEDTEKKGGKEEEGERGKTTRKKRVTANTNCLMLSNGQKQTFSIFLNK